MCASSVIRSRSSLDRTEQLGVGLGREGDFRIGYGEVGIDYEMWGIEVEAKPVNDDVVKVEKALITGLWLNASASSAQCYVDKLGGES